MKYSERHSKFPNMVIISYPIRWGGNMKDRKLWLAESNTEVLDYGTKDYLIKDAISNGREYVVLTVHRNYDATVKILSWICKHCGRRNQGNVCSGCGFGATYER
jgi:hypothetical protein